MKFRFYYIIAKLLFLIITPLVLLCLPVGFFDKGQSICLSQLLFHTQCYGCGITRACMHLIHFDFKGAAAYNMLSFIVLPILMVVWVQAFFKERKRLIALRHKMIGAPVAPPPIV